MNISQIKDYCDNYGVKLPAGLNKKKLIYYKDMLDYAIDNNLQIITNITKKNMIATNNWIGNTDSILYYQPVRKDDSLDWLTHFYTYGWTTVQIPNFDNDMIANDLLSWIEHMNNGFNRYNINTWNNTPRRFNGIFKHYIGHEEFMWKAREATYPLFSKFWENEDLVSSFDGACFMNKNNRQKSWFHWDHSRWAGNNASVQGFVNLGNLTSNGNINDNGYLEGGLVLLEGSHHIYDNYLERHPLEGHSPYFFIDMNDAMLNICRPIKICAKKGELVLWNSKMAHCNVTPYNKSARMCIYVSMQPKSIYSQEDINKGIKAAENGRMTNHLRGGEDFKINTIHANWTRDSDKPNYITKPKLNQLRRKLIGY